MPLDAAARASINRFRDRFEQALRGDDRFGPPERVDRDDESTLQTRFAVGERLWLELALRPFLPQVRVGIMTDDRWRSEDLEDAIESSGDEMDEFVEMGFEEAGLTWKEPPVEHYRDQGKFFYFATPLDLSKLTELDSEAVFDRTRRMFEGYFEAFRATIRKGAASA
ncbi:MAG: hypothetical protein IPM64_06175 [Phycisphaerales bacterium]|nr:hypothetical protein [Phycisphaerales bacterium]